MDVDRLLAVGHRPEDTEAAVLVGGPQQSEHPVSGAVHGLLLQSALRGAREHDDDLRAGGVAQPGGERLDDGPGGQVLVLQVDDLAGGGDRGQIQRLHLTDLALLGVQRHGARDPDIDVTQRRLQRVRPRVLAGPDRIQRPTHSGAPPFAGQFSERPRRRPVDRDGDLVARRVVAAQYPPQSVVVPVLAGVPSFGGEVDATAERDRVVDDQDLLVVHRSGGVRAVHREVQPPAAEPVHQRDRRDAVPEVVERRQQSQVGLQEMDSQVGLLPEHPLQEGAQPVGAGQRRAAPLQGDPGVEVPADQQDAVAGPQHGRLGMTEVVGAVDDACQSVGGFHAPAGATGLQQARG